MNNTVSAAIGRTRVRRDILAPWPSQAMLGLLDRDPDGIGEDDPLPLGWHWLYFNEPLRASRLGTDGHEERGAFMPVVDLPRRMWAGGELRSLGPIRLGAPAELRSTVRSVNEKRGRSGRLVFVTVEHAVLQDGYQCVHEKQVIVYTGSRPPTPTPAPAPQGRVPAPEWTRTLLPTTTTLFQFSALTYNPHRIHYDHPYVTGQEGYPGLLVHGPLTALLLLDAAGRYAPAPPARFRYRALAPLYADEPITLAGRSEPSPGADAGRAGRSESSRGADAGRASRSESSPGADVGRAGRPSSHPERIVEALTPTGTVAMRGWVS